MPLTGEIVLDLSLGRTQTHPQGSRPNKGGCTAKAHSPLFRSPCPAAAIIYVARNPFYGWLPTSKRFHGSGLHFLQNKGLDLLPGQAQNKGELLVQHAFGVL